MIRLLKVLVLCTPIMCAGRAQSLVTFTGGERLGDKLKGFIKAHYYADKLKLPCSYNPFEYCEQFYFSTVEQPCFMMHAYQKYDVTMFHQRHLHTPYRSPTKRPILYLVSYKKDDGDFFDAVHDRAFKQKMRTLLTPRAPMMLDLPKDRVCVALHMRKGGGYDMPLLADGAPIAAGAKAQGGSNPTHKPSDVVWPAKFPPEGYYVLALKKMAEMLAGKSLYVYLFTDDPHPEALAERLRHEVGEAPIVFDYRTEGNRHDAHVVEDFFAMAQFDCLIRPDSGISHAAEFIGEHALIIKPGKITWRRNKLCVDEIVVRIWGSLLQGKVGDVQGTFKNDTLFRFEKLH